MKKYCEVCGKNNIEVHHVIFRSHAEYLKNVNMNLMYLCPEHHRGNEGPHMNRDKDLDYKMDLQKKYFELFQEKDFYTFDEIKIKLGCTKSMLEHILKTVRIHKEGYKKTDIVIRLMGNRLYAK